MFEDILAECIYRLNKDIKKWAIVILIVFFAGFTAGFCAGKAVEESIGEKVENGAKTLSEVWGDIHAEDRQANILQ